MPKAKTGLTTSEYVVLGLLQGRAAYGYELQRHLSGGAGLARACPIEPAMVYAVLKSLSGLELIDGHWDTSQYPPRAVYTATPEGEAAFERWLRHPVGRMREVRSDFLAKLYFALERDAALARELAQAQVAACEEYERRLRDELGGVEEGSFDAIVLKSKLTAALSTREWIEEWLRESRSSR
ncbi:MAG TPA: helix-turn-helix transcriptional regulator [Dehalococcoidia bacterium]|nr:helix-turn-helix transcriptional regulator [Dehalococcoidia bacterium]